MLAGDTLADNLGEFVDEDLGLSSSLVDTTLCERGESGTVSLNHLSLRVGQNLGQHILYFNID